jgi:AcrR family transcriptional regulator
METHLAASEQSGVEPGENDPDPAVAPRRYSSKGMRDRKQRILMEAQKLVEEFGVEGFTIRGLSSRAKVAPRTLYNLFGSKEDIIASAIEHYFDVLLEDLPPPPQPDDIVGVVDRLRQISDIIMSLRRYATAMVGVFFSPATDPRIHDSLVRISAVGTGHWLGAAEAAHILRPLDAAQRGVLTGLAVNAGYANVGDWVSGRIGAREFKRRAQVNTLLITFVFLRAEHQSPVRKIIQRLVLEQIEVERDPPQPNP